MNPLQQFLMENKVDNLTKEITLKGRLEEFPITIKAITGEQHSEYQQMCFENMNSPKKRRFNGKRFHELIVINCTLNPNFKDPEWLQEAGVTDPTALMYRSLLAGEIAAIAEAVLDLAGFNSDVEDDMEEVKNS